MSDIQVSPWWGRGDGVSVAVGLVFWLLFLIACGGGGGFVFPPKTSIFHPPVAGISLCLSVQSKLVSSSLALFSKRLQEHPHIIFQIKTSFSIFCRLKKIKLLGNDFHLLQRAGMLILPANCGSIVIKYQSTSCARFLSLATFSNAFSSHG